MKPASAPLVSHSDIHTLLHMNQVAGSQHVEKLKIRCTTAQRQAIAPLGPSTQAAAFLQKTHLKALVGQVTGCRDPRQTAADYHHGRRHRSHTFKRSPTFSEPEGPRR